MTKTAKELPLCHSSASPTALLRNFYATKVSVAQRILLMAPILAYRVPVRVPNRAAQVRPPAT
jgi:hypothetical protein